MKLTKKEFRVLWAVEEGMSFLENVEMFTNYKIDAIKKAFDNLSKMGLIELTKKFDSHYRKDAWHASTTEKAKRLYDKYSKWIPK